MHACMRTHLHTRLHARVSAHRYVEDLIDSFRLNIVLAYIVMTYVVMAYIVRVRAYMLMTRRYVEDLIDTFGLNITWKYFSNYSDRIEYEMLQAYAPTTMTM